MDLLGEAFSCWEKVQSASDKHEVVEGWEVVLSALADGLELALPNNLARTKVCTQSPLPLSLPSSSIEFLLLFFTVAFANPPPNLPVFYLHPLPLSETCILPSLR